MAQLEEFAVRYAMEFLGSRWANISAVEGRDYGYDLEAEDETTRRVYVEFKGRPFDADVELTPNETRTADLHGGAF